MLIYAETETVANRDLMEFYVTFSDAMVVKRILADGNRPI